MDIVQKEKTIINELIAIYSEEDFLNDLSINAKNIANHIKTLLNDEGGNNDLITKNSIRNLKYFSLIRRIKEPDSLKEKFYRGNLLHEIFKDLKFGNGSDVKKQKNKVRLMFKKCDDVIGVKILTDLNADCKKVISILRNNESHLKSVGISLKTKDLAAQPQKMKNGLDIYKINGTFNSIYTFELQVKSKLQSVWGDMEHSIFYKDYFISPVRETTQATMNHIGKLLFQIDEFLLDVRNANKEFKSNSKVTTFLSWFDDNYSGKIAKKLGGVGYKIDSISEALYFIKSNKNIKIRELQFDHFKFKSSSIFYNNYIELRNNSYDLKIFESIVFSWLWSPSQVRKNNIESKYKIYFNLIVNYLSKSLFNKYSGLKIENIRIKINKYFKNLLEFQPKAEIFLSSREFIKHFNFMNFVKSILDIYDLDINSFYYSKLDLLFLNKRLNGNSAGQIVSMNFKKAEIDKIGEILIKLDSSIKIDEKIEFKKESSFIAELISLLNKKPL